MQEPLDANRIRSGLSPVTRRWLARLEVFESIDSTNSYLMRQAADGSIDGWACLAEQQTAGRGRRGRSWTTPRAGGIALSLGQQVDVPTARLGALSLVVGLAVAAALEREGVQGVGLKWPNDVWLHGAKLGGILIEVVPLRQPAVTVVGVGINVARDAAGLAAVGTPVATIADIRADISRNALAAALIDAIHDGAVQFEKAGFEPFRARWNAVDVHRDRAVTILAGEQRIEGIARGVGRAGELILETSAGERRFTGGEVSLRAAQ